MVELKLIHLKSLRPVKEGKEKEAEGFNFSFFFLSSIRAC